jgi:hypothetical protein
VQRPRYGCSFLSHNYEALQAAENLNSDGRASICFKQSCPQPPRIGQRKHSLSRRQGSSKAPVGAADQALYKTKGRTVRKLSVAM